jgi:hypothetical protein
MKKNCFGLLLILSAFILPITAFAQSNEMTKASIPFAFYAGKKEMPAGTYTMRVDDDDRQLLLQNADGSAATFLVALPGDTSQPLNPGFHFDKVGDAYFLRAATDSDQDFYLSKTKLEKQMERNGTLAQSAFITNGL